MGLDPWEQAVLRKWRSMKLVYRFMEQKVAQICRECFREDLPHPQVTVRRMKFSRSLHGGYLGAHYRPPKAERPAQIGIFPFLLLDRQAITIALAHELIHHWEHLYPNGHHPWPYPDHIQRLVKNRFESHSQEYHWRQVHSSRFLSKAWEVAQRLKLPIAGFLFRG